MSDPDLIPCNNPNYTEKYNFDQPPPYCGPQDEPSLMDVPGPDVAPLLDHSLSNRGYGDSALCDPMLKGHIINDQDGVGPSPSHIYTYSRALQGCDEAMEKIFSDIIVIDTQDKFHRVPIINGPQEKAVAMLVQENVRQDDSNVVDSLRLPLLAIHRKEVTPNQERFLFHKAQDFLRRPDGTPGFTTKERFSSRDTVFGVTRGLPLDISYTLYIWTLYREDMDIILEQVLPKIYPMGYIRVSGVSWETPVKVDAVRNSSETEPGDQGVDVFKYEIDMTVETFLPQAITRSKAVLKTKIDIVDTVDQNQVSQVLARLEEAVKELQ